MLITIYNVLLSRQDVNTIFIVFLVNLVRECGDLVTKQTAGVSAGCMLDELLKLNGHYIYVTKEESVRDTAPCGWSGLSTANSVKFI